MISLSSLPSWVCLLGFDTGGSHDDSLDTPRIGGQVGGGAGSGFPGQGGLLHCEYHPGQQCLKTGKTLTMEEEWD